MHTGCHCSRKALGCVGTSKVSAVLDTPNTTVPPEVAAIPSVKGTPGRAQSLHQLYLRHRTYSLLRNLF